jgi:hypothetical protein
MKIALFLLIILVSQVALADEATSKEIVAAWADLLVDWGSKIIAAASIVSALTPTKKDDKALSIFRTVIDVLAINFGRDRKK